MDQMTTEERMAVRDMIGLIQVSVPEPVPYGWTSTELPPKVTRAESLDTEGGSCD